MSTVETVDKPKRSESRRRTRMIALRVTPDEHTDIKTRAAALGMSMGALARTRLLADVARGKAGHVHWFLVGAGNRCAYTTDAGRCDYERPDPSP